MVYKIGGLVAFLVVWLGFIGPYCMSADSAELTVGYTVLTFILVLVAINKIYKRLKSGDNDEA